MNRILTLGVLALGLILGSQQQASAWCNFKFGAGINWDYQSGNNEVWLGTLPQRWRDPTAPECFGCGGLPRRLPRARTMSYGGGPGPSCYAGRRLRHRPGVCRHAGLRPRAMARTTAPEPGAPANCTNGTAAVRNRLRRLRPATPRRRTWKATTIPNYQSGQTPYQCRTSNFGWISDELPGSVSRRDSSTIRTGRTATTAAATTHGTQPAYALAGTGIWATDVDCRISMTNCIHRLTGTPSAVSGRFRCRRSGFPAGR